MKPIPYSNGYFADKEGNIYSIRPFKRSNSFREVPIKLSPILTNRGYYVVRIIFKEKIKIKPVHYLVLLTFKGDRPTDKSIVLHGEKGRMDNSLGNLSWGTYSKNNKEDRLRDGTLHRGDIHHNSKLSSEKVREIRKLVSDGISQREIAERMKVHYSTVNSVIKGRNWSHII